MSATLSWQPDKPNPLDGGSSSVARQLQAVFGDFPMTLTHNDDLQLLAMKAMYDGNPNPFEALGNAIAEFGSIVVTVSY